jgi:PKD repeat protein
VKDLLLDFQRRLERRHRQVAGFDLFLELLFLCTCTAATVLLVVRVGCEVGAWKSPLGSPGAVLVTLAVALALSLTVSGLIFLIRSRPTFSLTWSTDRQIGPEAQYLTALESAQRGFDSRFDPLLIDSAVHVIRRADLRRLLPVTRPGYRLGTLLAFLAAALLMTFPPRVYVRPAPNVAVLEPRGVAPFDAVFLNLSSGVIDSFRWDFGDGGASSEEAPVHRFEKPGRYSVRLSAQGPGGSAEALVENAVEVLPEAAPLARFEAEPVKGRVPLDVRFQNLSMNAGRFRWDFGDGVTAEVREPVHRYDRSGRFTVSLTALDARGSDRAVRHDFIYAAGPEAPLADFRAHPRKGSAPLTAAFEDLSTGAVNGWSWDFGDLYGRDQKTSIERHPTHTYRFPGRYTVTLTLRGPGGKDVEEKKMYVLIDQTGDGKGGGGGMSSKSQTGGGAGASGPAGASAAKHPGRLFGETSGRCKVELVPEGVDVLTREGGSTVPRIRSIGVPTDLSGGGGIRERPLQEVYGQYARAAEDAIRKERIPLSARSYLQRYFQALRPVPAPDSK